MDLSGWLCESLQSKLVEENIDRWCFLRSLAAEEDARPPQPIPGQAVPLHFAVSRKP